MSDTDGLSFEEQLSQTSGKRKRRAIVVLIGMGAALGAGGILWIRSAKAEAQATLHASWSELNQCLVGASSEDAGSLRRRFRNTQLTMLGKADAERRKGSELPWPRSCTDLAFGTAKAAESVDPKEALIGSSQSLAKALKVGTSVSDDLGPLLDAVSRDADALALVAKAGTGVTPLAAAQPMDVDTLQNKKRFLPGTIKLERLRTDATPGKALRILIDDGTHPNTPALCSSGAGGLKLSCTALPAAVRKLSPGLNLWGTTEPQARPFIFAGDRGRAGVYRMPDGKRIADTVTYGASALNDGSLVRTVWNKAEHRLDYAIHPPSGEPRVTPLLPYEEVGEPYYNTGLFGKFLVYRDYVENKGLQLLVREVGENGELSPVKEVGRMKQSSRIDSDKTPHITACQTEDDMVLRLKGRTVQYLAFHVDGRWTPPVTVRRTGGTLTCHDGTAVLTWLDATHSDSPFWPSISQTRCSPTSCESEHVDFKNVLRDTPELAPIDADHVTVAELDGNVLFLWGAGERGGLRMRFAPLGQLAKAEDKVLYDDLIEHGKLQERSTLIETRLIPGGNHALLFLSTAAGVSVLHVNTKGEVTDVESSFN